MDNLPSLTPQREEELDNLRRRAGITKEYEKLNPQPLMVPMTQNDLIGLIAALEQIAQISEMVPMYQLLNKLKKIAGRNPQPQRVPHSPRDENNPFYASVVTRGSD